MSTKQRNIIQPTRVINEASQISSSTQQLVAQSTPSTNSIGQPPTRIRDTQATGSEETPAVGRSEPAVEASAPQGVVYGKPAEPSAKPTGPPPSQQQQQQQVAGRPFIQTASIDSQVRPFAGPAARQPQQQQQVPFRASKPAGSGLSPSVVGSAFTIVAQGNQTGMPTGDIQDYVANQPQVVVNGEPTISAQGGPDPFELAPVVPAETTGVHQELGNGGGSSSTTTTTTQAPKVRRPTFKPKPAVPPIRIDSCIVGDDSSCDQSHNERCVTEYGISSCHCRPGYARLSQLRGYCSPVVALQFAMKIDKLSDERKLVFNHSLENANSEEYQYLEFETLQAVASGMQQTSLSKQYMGARVNKFLERKGRIWANVSVQLELNNVTKNEQAVQKLMAQELTKLQRQRQPLGDSTIVLDAAYRDSVAASPSPAFSKLQDLNECANKELNDCSKHATCTNDFGSFSCQCLPGYEDKYHAQWLADQAHGNATSSSPDKSKMGRTCMGCSPAYCSNRGECSIENGKKQCKCRANFMGARCDIDSEVLAVAIGGSLVGLLILVVTFWCLFVFNRRWRREQQKMDAMSATSGLTNYNYASNSANSTNSLMSPAAALAAQQSAAAAAAARSIGGRSAALAAANYVGQRFVGGLIGRSGASGHHSYHQHHHLQQQYALEQHAMLVGSGASSGSSSAASQPLACNPYQTPAASYAYDDGLLIAPASTGSSEQTSPSGNSYRGIIPSSNTNHSAAMMAAAGNAYTLSGHHHHHHHHHQQQQQQQQQLYHRLHHMTHHGSGKQQQQQQTFSQFHPIDPMHQQYARTLANNAQSGYDSRWRTLQGQQQDKLTGYYLAR